MRIESVQKTRSCRLRRESTPAEAILWRRLRDRRLIGWKCRRQHPIGPFIVDFYCPETKLVVELDGDVHLGREKNDESRTKLLEERGLKVLRFWNPDIRHNLDIVLETILNECEVRGGRKNPSP